VGGVKRSVSDIQAIGWKKSSGEKKKNASSNPDWYTTGKKKGDSSVPVGTEKKEKKKV